VKQVTTTTVSALLIFYCSTSEQYLKNITKQVLFLIYSQNIFLWELSTFSCSLKSFHYRWGCWT